MVNSPLVSIIIIFLNAERFIQEAIESIFAQSYQAWELLLVDDGSTDRGTSIARSYAEKNPKRVRYFEHPGHQNRGKSISRNLGIANAKGTYIAFLDADDVWLPDKLKSQVGILESEPKAGMVYGLSKWWYSWTGIADDSKRDFQYELGVPAETIIQPPSLITSFFLTQRAAIPNPSSILVRSDVFDKIGGFEESVTGLYEDQALLAKICVQFPVYASSECWDFYRQHQDSSTVNVQKRGDDFKERLIFLNWLSGYLEKRGFRDTPTWRLLKKDIWFTKYPLVNNVFRDRQKIKNWLNDVFFRIGRRTIPAPLRSWLWFRWHKQEYVPPVDWVRFGNLRRLTPISREFGYDRGIPIDRYYIEKFLSIHQQDIRGHVLEVQEAMYTQRFGGSRVLISDVLHVKPGNPGTTIVADLTSADQIESETFECIILTQTLQFIYDIHSVVKTIYRILKPGGVVLATFPGMSPISRYDMERWGDYWRFTTLSARRLFEETFPTEQIDIVAYGNVLTACAFLYGITSEELTQKEVEHLDPDYEVITAVRAVKPV